MLLFLAGCSKYFGKYSEITFGLSVKNGCLEIHCELRYPYKMGDNSDKTHGNPLFSFNFFVSLGLNFKRIYCVIPPKHW